MQLWVWVGAVGAGEEPQPSLVPQPCHPCCQVMLCLLGTCLAMAVWSWGCEATMLGPEHLKGPVLISLDMWGGGQGGAGGSQPVQALLLPHLSPGDRLVVWAGQGKQQPDRLGELKALHPPLCRPPSCAR